MDLVKKNMQRKYFCHGQKNPCHGQGRRDKNLT